MRDAQNSTSATLALAATIVATVAGITLGAPSDAEACTPARCTGLQLNVDDAEVPANLPSFRWSPKIDRSLDESELSDNLKIEVIDTETGEPWPISTERIDRNTFHVDFDKSPVAGRQYRFEGEHDCEHSGSSEYHAPFEVTEQAPRPSAIPRPSAGPLQYGDATIVSSGGSCGYPSQDVEAGYRHVRTEHTAQMKPWVDVWKTTAQIREVGEADFRDWHPPSTVKRPAVERRDVIETTLVTACEEPSEDFQRIVASLDPGRYDVRFEVSIPATDWTTRSEPTTVELHCPQAGDTGPDADVNPIDPDIGPHSDTGPEADAGPSSSDAGSDGRESKWSQREESASGAEGCGGCSTSDAPPLGAMSILLLLVGWLGTRSRPCTYSI